MNEADAVTGSLGEFLRLLISSGHAGPDSLVLVVIATSGVALAAIHGSIAARLIRIGLLVRDVRSVCEARSIDEREALLHDLDRAFADSLLADSWAELLQRRRELEAYAPEDRAPIQLADLLIDRPLIPTGIRRRAMKLLPGLFPALGLASTLGMLTGELGSAAIGGSTASIVGLSLRGAFWGIAMGTLAAAVAAVLEGTADALTTRLSLLVGRSYRSLTPIEAQLRGTEAQRLGFERVSSLLVQVAQELRDSLDRGLGRVEHSTAKAVSLVGEEQRRILDLVVEDLSGVLCRRVADQVGALRTSLQHAAQQQDTLGDRAVTTIDQLAAGANRNLLVSGALERTAQAVDDAAGTIAGSAAELKPLITHLSEVAATLERTARRVEQVQSQLNPGDGASAAMLSALRDDVTRIGTQFLDGTIALRHSVEPFQARHETQAERDVAQALANFHERAGALRQHLDEYDLEHDGFGGNGVGAASGVVALDIEIESQREPETRAMRRGGDLASALARSGEGLEADDRPEAQPSHEAPRVQAADPTLEEAAETDLEPVGRGGFSALLSRYAAPQFSIDELSEDLREFNVEDVAQRIHKASLSSGIEARDHQGDPTEVLESAAPTDEATDRDDELIAEAEGASTNEDIRERRPNRFLALK